MGFVKEFKEFAIKGNVIDLAIGVILAAAFGKIITALTESVIMPLISLIVGKPDFRAIAFTVNNTIFPVGILIQAIIDFILVALVLFMIIRGINRMNRKKAAPVSETKAPEYTLSEKLLMEIRDSLKR
jgi:large conductance mechanosensitive channel